MFRRARSEDARPAAAQTRQPGTGRPPARDRSFPGIAGYQVSDFALPLPVPENMNGRLFLGDGNIDLAALTASVIRAGYTGPVEVEIFIVDIWQLPLQTIIDRTVTSFNSHVTEPVGEHVNPLERELV